MDKGKAALAALVALCATAGAGGIYLATRSTEPAPAAIGAGNSAADPASQTVEESEAIVADDIEPQAPPRRDLNRRTAPPQVAGGPAERPTPVPRSDPQPIPEAVREPVGFTEPEPERAPDPAAPQFVDLVVPADSVVGLQVETALTSERAQVEDAVVARVTRDVRVSDRVAIPAGARAEGEVTLVERGGRLRERARLGIRFISVVLADGTRIPLDTEAIYREGEAPGGESAAKIGGGAIGGAIIGGILGGARGAVIGGSVGAGGGTAAVLAGGRNPATLPAGAPVTVRLVRPATVTVQKP